MMILNSTLEFDLRTYSQNFTSIPCSFRVNFLKIFKEIKENSWGKVGSEGKFLGAERN